MVYLLSPAKINLGLHIGDFNPTLAYHKIDSIFVPISWGDTIAIQENSHTPQSLNNFSSIGIKSEISFENKIYFSKSREDFNKVSSTTKNIQKILYTKLFF